MKSFFRNVRLSSINKICLAGLFIAISVICQKVIAVNYIPFIPFLRISFGGPAIIIFSSLLLGPWYGLLIGALSDVLGYFVFDMSSFAYFPTITFIYALLGFMPYFIFRLLRTIKSDKTLWMILSIFMVICVVGVTIFLWTNNTLKLYGSVHEINLLIRIIIPSSMFFLFGILLMLMILFDRHSKKLNTEKQINSIQLSLSLLIIELFIMVLFGSLMKGIAFGFQTFWVILLCQIIVMFVNVPLSYFIISLLSNIIQKRFKQKETSI